MRKNGGELAVFMADAQEALAGGGEGELRGGCWRVVVDDGDSRRGPAAAQS